MHCIHRGEVDRESSGESIGLTTSLISSWKGCLPWPVSRSLLLQPADSELQGTVGSG